MLREFTSEKLEELISYVDSREDMNWLEKKLDDRIDKLKRYALGYYNTMNYFTGGSYVESSERRSKNYYNCIVDVNNYCTSTLKVMFKLVNDKDDSVAKEFKYLTGEADKILHELKELTKIATPGGIDAAVNGASGIGDHVTTNGIVVNAPQISDEELEEYCKKAHAYEYNSAVSNVSKAVCEMDFLTALCIATFNHKEILIDTLMNTPGAGDVKKYVCEQIVDGAEGYISVDDVIDALAAKGLIDPSDKNTVEYIRRMLKAKANGSNYLPPMLEPGDGFRAPNGDSLGLMVSSEVDKIILGEIQRMIKDEGRLKEYCFSVGRDPTIVEAAFNGEVNGYSVSLYKKTLAKSLEKICEEQSYNLYPDDFKKILSLLKGGDKLYSNSTEAGKALKKMMGNGVLSDEEASLFIKQYLGGDGATASQIKSLRFVAENWDLFKKFDKGVGYTQDAIDTISYWAADYQGEIEMLDGMIEAARTSGDPEYLYALERLRKTYSDKFFGTFEKATETVLSKGYDKALSATSDYVFGTPLLTLAETAISMTGKITGASGKYSAAQELLGYSTITSECVSNYGNAVRAVADGAIDENSLMNVRTTFTIMKQTLTDYYSAQIKYAQGTIFEDNHTTYVSYLEYELEQLKNTKLGDAFEAISYEEFLDTYGA